MSHNNWVAGDRTKIIRTCKDKENNNAIIDLTGVNKVELLYSIEGAPTVTVLMVVIAPPTNGKVEYEFKANELTEGEIEGAVQITDGTNKIFTQIDPFTRTIRGKI